ncbi:Uma2 family endonuclease [Thermus tengchongensis]|uniref:Uma2 family endonuclease n=2 Tax=Thermus tengchongensis TaxID=1214928 RepID=A0A4Y9F8K3_9DEIN|nr:Uma2 family endonuclease [Thermus tengchongensis]
MMGEAARRLEPLSLEAYLELEARSPVKHELVEGTLHAMAGASRAHNLIVTNLALLLGPLARRRGCRLYVADMKLKVGERTVYYPDLMAVCAPPPENPYYEEAPCLVVEVLSESTEGVDRREKLWRYLALPSLQAYLLVSALERRAELYWKKGGEVFYQVLEAGEVPLPCLEGSLPLEEAYAGVDLEGRPG